VRAGGPEGLVGGGSASVVSRVRAGCSRSAPSHPLGATGFRPARRKPIDLQQNDHQNGEAVEANFNGSRPQLQATAAGEIGASCTGRISGDVLYSTKLPRGFLPSVLYRQKFVGLRN
jgi:hypothetical protein